MTFHTPELEATHDASDTLPDVHRLLVRGVLVSSWAAMLAVLLLALFSRGLAAVGAIRPVRAEPRPARPPSWCARFWGEPLQPRPLGVC